MMILLGGGGINFPDGAVYHGGLARTGPHGFAHGLGTMTAPRGQGVYAGLWNQGTEELGERRDNTQGCFYSGRFDLGQQHTLGVQVLGGTTYKGDWAVGKKSGHGALKSAKNKGEFSGQMLDNHSHGYGTWVGEDGGSYGGEWLGGHRAGFGARISTEFGSPSFLGYEAFVLSTQVDEFAGRPIPQGVVETYHGQWKKTERNGFGVSERTDGLKYEGQWVDNYRSGFGVTTKPDGSKEEGKYKNGVLVAKVHLGFRDIFRGFRHADPLDVAAAVASAERAAEVAKEKATIAAQHADIAQDKARQAEDVSREAHHQAQLAIAYARQFHRAEGA